VFDVLGIDFVVWVFVATMPVYVCCIYLPLRCWVLLDCGTFTAMDVGTCRYRTFYRSRWMLVVVYRFFVQRLRYLRSVPLGAVWTYRLRLYTPRCAFTILPVTVDSICGACVVTFAPAAFTAFVTVAAAFCAPFVYSLLLLRLPIE